MSVYMPFDPCRHLPVQFEQCGLPVCYRDDAVSDPFVELIRETLIQIPAPLLEMVGNRGFILVLSQLMSDVHPQEQFKKPRGHHQKAKGDDVSGSCCPEQRHIHITEATRFCKSTNTANTLRHELGHAVDHAAGFVVGVGRRAVSLTFDFNQEFQADITRMPYAEQARLNYYIQKRSPAGRSEAFAEAIAMLLGGGCQDSHYFRQHFSQVVAWVEWNVFSPVIAAAACHSSFSALTRFGDSGVYPLSGDR